MTTILVVEDERDLRQLLRRYLERSGYAVLTTGSGAEALAMVESGGVDLVLLDLGLPDLDGLEVLREVGARTPVVVLTARSDVSDRITGLEKGAADYVTKPFSPREVMLRVQAVLGRSAQAGSVDAAEAFGGGRLVIRAERREVELDGSPVSLTPSEWGVLTALAGLPGKVYSRLELVNRARGYEFAGYERNIDSHVKNLRRKLAPAGQEIIVTIPGVGYRLGWDRDD